MLGGCDWSNGDESQPPAGQATRSVEGFVATLQREVRELPAERMAWSTFWRLCWSRFPGARAYELATLTGEGRSPQLRRQRARCLRLEVAAGENARSERFKDERTQLALTAGQLAYRVRAVRADGGVTRWSRPYAAGERVDAGEAP